MSTIKEIQADVVIIGGGLAGVCAALACARVVDNTNLQLKVVLIQNRPVLGGCSSTEIRVPPVGAGRHPWGFETGIIHELLIAERMRNHTRWDNGQGSSMWDLTLLEKVREQPNLTLLLNTEINEVSTRGNDDSRSIQTLYGYQSGSETRVVISAAYFIDCTGDGTVGYLAGANCLRGREPKARFGESLAPENGDDQAMGSSLHFKAIDVGFPIKFNPPSYAEIYPTEESLVGREHRYADSGYWWIEVGSPFDTIRDNELIRDELLRHVMGVWDHLKNHCPKHKDQLATWALDWIGMVPGKRESRRLEGMHILNECELRAGQLFPDRVAYGGHFFDLHTLGGILTARDNQPGNPVDLDPLLWDSCRMNPYSIPLRSLYSNNIKNLFMAGRCISASHVAFGSVRVMNTGALTGQAAGVAAFHCIRTGLTPDRLAETAIQDIQESLLRQDCFIPHRAAQDENDFAKVANITASSQMAFSGIVPDEDIADLMARFPDDRQEMKEPFGALIPMSEEKIETVSIWLESDSQCTSTVKISLLQASHIWDYTGNPPVMEREFVIQPKHIGWLEIPLHVPVEPGRLYWLKTSIVEGHVYWRYMRGLRWPGTLSIWQRQETSLWKHFFGGHKQPFTMLLYKISPTSHPFSPANIISGVTRPEKFTNIWISDPLQAFPQWIELRWPEKRSIHCVEITFDTDLSLTNETVAAPYDYPTLVKTYSLQIQDGSGAWQIVANRIDNTSRKVVHRLEGISTVALRLNIDATRGDRSARVYEIRTY